MIAALTDAGAFLTGHFQLNSGRHSDRYLEKFNMLQWPRYTELVCRKMAEAGHAYAPQTIAGPTTGGIVLAYEIGRQLGLRGIFCERAPEGGRSFQRDFRLQPGERVMVVDDVMTSGESVFDTIGAVQKAGGVVTSVAVMVDRSGGKVTFDVPSFAATEVDMQTWAADECPLCKQGVPLKIT
ncbi:MAG: orotate phosphoribosyltransferase [Chloroflexi bacterium]|nr:MAG: orotate phosphoribosyltransferase [Chloroflexota bacterium]